MRRPNTPFGSFGGFGAANKWEDADGKDGHDHELPLTCCTGGPLILAPLVSPTLVGDVMH